MVCGGFACSRNALCALNVVYVLVGVLLVGVSGWARGWEVVTPPLAGGVTALGTLLLLLALLGLLGARHHHQVLLFFYMLILGLLFIVQFGVSCSCLALSPARQEQLFLSAWPLLSNETRRGLERSLDCCGARPSPTPAPPRPRPLPGTPPPPGEQTPPSPSPPDADTDLRYCPARCRSGGGRGPCGGCGEKLLPRVAQALRILGGVGLFFSFTEILGVWLAMRYRNQKDPRANPSAFL